MSLADLLKDARKELAKAEEELQVRTVLLRLEGRPAPHPFSHYVQQIAYKKKWIAILEGALDGP